LNWGTGPQEIKLHDGFSAEEEKKNILFIYLLTYVCGRKLRL
jgi:hypothetical protein